MGLNLNPANWGIINTLQGQTSGGNQTGGQGGGGGGWSSAPQGGFTGPGGERGAHSFTTILNPMTTQQSLEPLAERNTIGAVPVDPYAKWGGQSAFNTLKSGFDTQKGNIFSSIGDATNTAARQYGSSILDFIDSLRNSQRGVDTKAVNNEMARTQGQQGVMGMVGRGIQSGGVQLANKNASDSSAAGAIARAYGDIGRRQMSSVGNQYEMGNRDIADQQMMVDQSRATGLRKFGESKEDVVGGIVSAGSEKLAALDAAMASASMPDRIQIEQEKTRIRNDVLGRLAQYDQQLNTGVAGIAPTSADARRTQAIEWANAGQAPADSFNYDTETPAQYQNTGPFGSALPIFTFRNRREA